jgi:mycofactocin system creatininase family protein
MTRLDTMTWPEATAQAHPGSVLLIPFGSTEQHGPHLPLSTDTDIARAIANGVDDRLDDVMVAPSLAYGSSGEHQEFAGTLSIGQDATELLLVELGRSACEHFAHVIVVSAHGGNVAAVSRAMSRLTGEGRPVASWSPSWPGDLHAGRTETSLMLSIAPDRVRLDRAEPGDLRTIEVLLPLMRLHGVLPISANGVLGDPAGAGADEGEALLSEAVGGLCRTIAALRGETSGVTT